ncbi:MAG: acyltransferase, partial [Methanobacteriaceae archaeon]
ISELALISTNPTNFSFPFLATLNASFRFAVPLFLMLSGALLLNKDYSYLNFFCRRYPRVIAPFLFWGTIYIVFSALFYDKAYYFASFNSSLFYIANMFFGIKGFLSHFWFVWLIIVAYLLMPAVNRWIKDASNKEISGFIAIWIIASFISFYLLPTEFNMVYFAGLIFFTVFGYYINNISNIVANITDNGSDNGSKFDIVNCINNIFNNRSIWNRSIWIALFIITTAIRAYMIYSSAIISGVFIWGQAGDEYNILSIIQVLSIFLIAKLTFNNENVKNNIHNIPNIPKNRIKNLFNQIVTTLSKYSYGIYLSHMIFIFILIDLGLSFTNINIFLVFFIGIFVLIVSILLLNLLNRIPILKYFTGIH